jgi:hypothetical protein
MREHTQQIGSLARKAYGRGRLDMKLTGEWFWIPERGGRVYLGWSLTGAEHRLRAAISANTRRPPPARV